ncbi:MAG: hypothetical protein LBQ47_07345 [Endomicrobium sp.]|nr:hypothetical protein [Endomicrobium sp.]
MSKRYLVPLIVCLFFIASAFFSISYIAIEANHDCSGHECPICDHIRQLTNVLKHTSLMFFSVSFVLFLFAEYKPSKFFASSPPVSYRFPTLISLKVIMND